MDTIELKKVIASDHFHLLKLVSETTDEYEQKRIEYLSELSAQGIEPAKSIGDLQFERAQLHFPPPCPLAF